MAPRLGFTGHESAIGVGNRDEPRPAETTDARHVSENPHVLGAARQRGLQRRTGPAVTHTRQRQKVTPEDSWVAKPAERDVAQRRVAFRQDDRRATARETLAVAFENRLTHGAIREGKLPVASGQKRAGGETDQIMRVGELARFVEVVDTPDQPTFHIAPRSEVFEMQIANGQASRSVGHRVIERPPALDPPVKRRAKEDEGSLAHPLVLQPQVAASNRRLRPQPRLYSCVAVMISMVGFRAT